MEGYQWGGGGGRIGEKVQRIRGINGRQKIGGEVKNSIGNGEAKELICMTHGHELRLENDGGWYRTEGNKGEKNMGQL